jgi:hypothetical protein
MGHLIGVESKITSECRPERSFEEELKELLEKQGGQYDPKYLV